MKKFFIWSILLLSSFSYSQEMEILHSGNISRLNSIIDSLETIHSRKESPQFYSMPQTEGDAFRITTMDPEGFITDLNSEKGWKQLQQKYQNLQTDFDLLLIKNIYTDYRGEEVLEVKSFDIGESNNHLVRKAYNDSLNRNDLKFIYQTRTGKKDSSTDIWGFYFEEEFKTVPLPLKVNSQIHYVDVLIDPDFDLFTNQVTESYGLEVREQNIIDSLVNHFTKVTNKPAHSESSSFREYSEKLREWENKRAFFADSLYGNDSKFKNYFQKARTYAVEERISNPDLEFFIARFISLQEALELKRNNRIVGTCSMDNSPLAQQKEMAVLAAEIPNWNVFIKAFMNVLNDNVSRIANSNIATNSRKTYIEELDKLDLNLSSLLFGSAYKISNGRKGHYFTSGNKTGQAFASLSKDYRNLFEETVEQLIKEDKMDDFNKLHFYNIFKHYSYFTTDSIEKVLIDRKAKELVSYLPYTVRSRIEQPHKQLKDLLHREQDLLDQYEILSSGVGNYTTFSHNGRSWLASLKRKNEKLPIHFYLVMPIDSVITPLKDFTVHEESLLRRVKDHDFLMEILKEDPENRMSVKFTRNRSFVDHYGHLTAKIPDDLKNDLSFDDAIYLSVIYPNRRVVNFLLFRNNHLMVLEIPKGFNLKNYSFEELLTQTEEGFLDNSYYSHRIFDERGKMLK